MRFHGHRSSGFTLLDVMITVTIIAILATIVIPLLGTHIDRANKAAAESTFRMVRKGLDLYFERHGRWPDVLAKDLFVNGQEVLMPEGYQLKYTPQSGDLALLTPENGAEPDGEPVVLVEP